MWLHMPGCAEGRSLEMHGGLRSIAAGEAAQLLTTILSSAAVTCDMWWGWGPAG